MIFIEGIAQGLHVIRTNHKIIAGPVGHVNSLAMAEKKEPVKIAWEDTTEDTTSRESFTSTSISFKNFFTKYFWQCIKGTLLIALVLTGIITVTFGVVNYVNNLELRSKIDQQQNAMDAMNHSCVTQVNRLFEEVNRLSKEVNQLSVESKKNCSPLSSANDISDILNSVQMNITVLSDHLEQSVIKLNNLETSIDSVNNTTLTLLGQFQQQFDQLQIQADQNENATRQLNDTMLSLVYELELTREELEELAIASHGNFSQLWNTTAGLIHSIEEASNNISVFRNTLANIGGNLTQLKLNTTAELASVRADITTECRSIRGYVNTELASLRQETVSESEFAGLQRDISDVRDESRTGDTNLRRYVDTRVKSGTRKFEPHYVCIYIFTCLVFISQ